MTMAQSGTSAAPDHDRVSCFIIGAGSLLTQCADMLLAAGHRIDGIVSTDPDVRQWAHDRTLPVHHPDADLHAFLSEQPFDYLFSINNSRVLPAPILRLPSKGAINYHDSLLPKYAGVYATSWALIQREAAHGISWHLMTEQVDGGDILQQRRVDVAPDDTAFSLNLKCYQAGIAAFGDLLTDLATHRVHAVGQNAADRSYFGRSHRPAACGVVR
jgi:methionyl-tRNA formyltransferase